MVQKMYSRIQKKKTEKKLKSSWFMVNLPITAISPKALKHWGMKSLNQALNTFRQQLKSATTNKPKIWRNSSKNLRRMMMYKTCTPQCVNRKSMHNKKGAQWAPFLLNYFFQFSQGRTLNLRSSVIFTDVQFLVLCTGRIKHIVVQDCLTNTAQPARTQLIFQSHINNVIEYI